MVQSRPAHLSREEGPVLELPQEEGDEEAAQHQAHGQQRRVGVRRLDGADDDGRVARGVVVNNRLLHLWTPGVFYAGVHVIVVHDQGMGLEDLKETEMDDGRVTAADRCSGVGGVDGDGLPSTAWQRFRR